MLLSGVQAAATANYGFKELKEPRYPYHFFSVLPEPEPDVMDEDDLCAAFAEIEAHSKALKK